VAILLKIYAKGIDGQDDIAKRRIEEALGDPGPGASEPDPPDSDDGPCGPRMRLSPWASAAHITKHIRQRCGARYLGHA